MLYVLKPDKITKEDVKLVGGKGANLGELVQAGFPVPECFFISVDAYYKFLEFNDLQYHISNIISKIDFSDINSLKKGSSEIVDLILNSRMPPQIKDEIATAYKDMMYAKFPSIEFIKAGRELPFVAIRSSAITEDIQKASSAGQYESFLNVRGYENVIYNVIRCWASLFTTRALYYRKKHGQPLETGIGVIIQRMLNADCSGVAFTVDPASPVEGKNSIIIEGCFGLGETLVQGQVEPDYYIVDKETGKLIEKRIGKKNIQRIRDYVSGTTIQQPVPPDKISAQVLADNEIIALAAYCKKIEQHYNYPQDIEWCTERGRIYIVQTRAVTALEKPKEIVAPVGTPILRGFGVSPGLATGPVKIIHDLAELGKIIQGDVLVTEMTSPDMVPAMEKSAAIITNSGGVTCHAAICSRELGIPCIVGAGNATEILKDGQEITVDALHGLVFPKEVAPIEIPVVVPEEKPAPVLEGFTATKIKVNLAFPKTATLELAARTDGIGLLRLEHMLTKAGMHPVEYIKQGKQDELIKILIDGIGQVAQVFKPKPVWVRSLDVRTDEYRNMQGGEKELTETNPLIGWHGIRRSLDEPEILKVEFTAIKKLHEQGLTNVAIMLPFVIDVEEIRRAKQIGREIGLPGAVQIGAMIETPAAALTMEDICKEVNFVSYGTNDLTMLVQGIDRNNEKLISIYNTFHPSVLKLMKDGIKTCKKYGVKSSICGEAGSDPKMAEILVEYGIDSISANIDAIDKIKVAVARTERKMLLEKVRREN